MAAYEYIQSTLHMSAFRGIGTRLLLVIFLSFPRANRSFVIGGCDVVEGQTGQFRQQLFTYCEARQSRLHSTRVRSKWDTRFEELQQFYQEQGHTDVTPSLNHTPGGLYSFVQYQRKQYRKWLAGDSSAAIDDTKIEKLKTVDFIFDKHLFTWEKRYKELLDFKEQFGHVNVPTKYRTLGQWVTKQRKLKLKGELKQNLIGKLDDVDFVWDVKEWQFTKGLSEVKEFKELNGHLDIKVTDDVGSWFYSRRKEFLALEFNGNSTLSEDHREALLEAGFGPQLAKRRKSTKISRASWEDRFEELKAFKALHNHTMVPRTPRFAQLSTWINYQRYLQSNGKLASKRSEALDSIGFIWNTNDWKWQMRFLELRDFQTKQGHCNVPRGAGDLGTWVDSQRLEKSNFDKGRKSHITAKRVALLNSIGFDYRRGETKRIEADLSWCRCYAELRKWKEAYGNCSVPRGVDPVLGLWVAHQRRSLKGFLRSEKTSLSAERIRQLMDVGLLDEAEVMDLCIQCFEKAAITQLS